MAKILQNNHWETVSTVSLKEHTNRQVHKLQSLLMSTMFLCNIHTRQSTMMNAARYIVISSRGLKTMAIASNAYS